MAQCVGRPSFSDFVGFDRGYERRGSTNSQRRQSNFELDWKCINTAALKVSPQVLWNIKNRWVFRKALKTNGPNYTSRSYSDLTRQLRTITTSWVPEVDWLLVSVNRSPLAQDLSDYTRVI